MRRTYVRRKVARTYTDVRVFPQALMYDERTPIWRPGVYVRRTTSKYGVQCCLRREINNKDNKIRKSGMPITGAQIYLLITESSGVRTCT